ncbi:MAG: ABC transporter permease, partial [Gemmatimonadetes bacterium]|nr:ABC transporter permease [Gemmatimonadota bacterium]
SGVYSPESGTNVTVQVTRIGPGYLEALGVPLLRGRPVGTEDVSGAEPVAVVTATLAESLYGGTSPLGRRLTLESGEEDEREVTIVGVAADFAGQAVESPHDHVLLSLAQAPSTKLALAIRANPASRANEDLVAAIERVYLELDRELPRPEIARFAAVMETSSADFPIWSAFFGLLAVLLLLLSALGIYGVVAFTVASRTREIGVRMSLGSSRADVLRQVLWEGTRLAVPGLVLGSAAGMAVAALVLNQIFVGMGLPLTGTGAQAAAALASLATVLLASLLPALRAASVDPLQALRAE